MLLFDFDYECYDGHFQYNHECLGTIRVADMPDRVTIRGAGRTFVGTGKDNPHSISALLTGPEDNLQSIVVAQPYFSRSANKEYMEKRIAACVGTFMLPFVGMTSYAVTIDQVEVDGKVGSFQDYLDIRGESEEGVLGNVLHMTEYGKPLRELLEGKEVVPFLMTVTRRWRRI